MSSPSLNRSVFAVDTVTHTIPESHTEAGVEPGADAGLTAQAIVVVALCGAGMWFLLWKTALLFLSGH